VSGGTHTAAAASAFVETIMSQLELTYVQATLRYAAILDKKVSEGKLRDELYDDQGAECDRVRQ
jgi:hypothetical protein